MICQYSWNKCFFINDNICGSFMLGQHLIFSALPDGASTRLSVKSGEDAEAQSTGLHDPLNFVLKRMGTTLSIRCRDHTNTVHISAGTGFWIDACVDWELLTI
jgi:hypothetical protein